MSRKVIPSTSQTLNPSPAPPGGQKPGGEEMMQKIWQGIQSLQHEVKSVQQNLEKRIDDFESSINGKMSNIDDKIGKIQERMDKTEEKIQTIQECFKQCDGRIKKIEEREEDEEEGYGNINIRLNDVERESLKSEMDRAEFYLRFQNVEEEKGEELFEKMTGILAEALDTTKEKMREEVDEVFRVFTRYAMRNKLPREVHIRFTKKSIKTQILQKASVKTFKYKEKEIVVLKQIPRRVRDIRRNYIFLTKNLLKKGVNYRWLFPEGLLFTWNEKRFRIDTIGKAERFCYENFGGKEEDQREEKLSTEQSKEEAVISDLDEVLGATGGVIESREKRSTRATKPSYKV